MKINSSTIFIFACSFACFLPFMNAAFALLLGISGALLFQNFDGFKHISGLLLKISIILMGFGLNWSRAISSSESGLYLTAFTVAFTLIFGMILGKILRLNSKTTLLITIGTAICGGSAIAAVSPIIQAKNEQFSLALLVVFLLNALALLIFPLAGHGLHLSQETFGTWAALSIHDTSSVVGAAAIYGNEALQVATTTKLTRALLIVPVVIFFSMKNAKLRSFNYRKLPWFILLFILAMIISNSLPEWSKGFEYLSWLGKKGLILALFFTGMTFNFSAIKRTAKKDFLFGIILWVAISSISLLLLVVF